MLSPNHTLSLALNDRMSEYTHNRLGTTQKTAELDSVIERQLALRKVRMLRQNRSAAEYAQEFKGITSNLGYNDAPLIYYFEGGLKDNVRLALCTKDLPKTLDEFILMAIKIDNNLYARRSGKRIHNKIA